MSLEHTILVKYLQITNISVYDQNLTIFGCPIILNFSDRTVELMLDLPSKILFLFASLK